ncbi:hypothetical protein ABT097_28080 [Streptomyces sp. NPDC002225]|uniref:hypothetical protein n=1 Tax=Streptomyces sp. NPDC002225 TaxID=3154413 RepID=UPI0033180554
MAAGEQQAQSGQEPGSAVIYLVRLRIDDGDGETVVTDKRDAAGVPGVTDAPADGRHRASVPREQLRQ